MFFHLKNFFLIAICEYNQKFVLFKLCGKTIFKLSTMFKFVNDKSPFYLAPPLQACLELIRVLNSPTTGIPQSINIKTYGLSKKANSLELNMYSYYIIQSKCNNTER